jgi:phosphate transporter
MGEEPDETFSRYLDVELEKISSFYNTKERELIDEVNQLLQDVRAYDQETDEAGVTPHFARRPDSSHSRGSVEQEIEDSDDDDDETTGLAKSRSSKGKRRRHSMSHFMHASTGDVTASTDLTRSLRRFSTTTLDFEQAAKGSLAIMLKKRIINLYVQLCELKSYAQLNKTGFSKILKKFDKILDKELRSKYMDAYVEPAYPFRPETLNLIEENISKMTEAYAEIVSGDDLEMARKELRSHLREHVVWERNTVWRDMIGLERRAEAASLGRTLLGMSSSGGPRLLQGDEPQLPPTKEIQTPVGRFRIPMWLFSWALMTLVVLTAIFFLVLFVPIMETPQQQNCLAILIYVSLLWATEVRLVMPPQAQVDC